MSAFKRSEKFDTIYILRVAEQRGMTSYVKIRLNLPKDVQTVYLTDGLEKSKADENCSLDFDETTQEIKLWMSPFKIQSMALSF